MERARAQTHTNTLSSTTHVGLISNNLLPFLLSCVSTRVHQVLYITKSVLRPNYRGIFVVLLLLSGLLWNVLSSVSCPSYSNHFDLI